MNKIKYFLLRTLSFLKVNSWKGKKYISECSYEQFVEIMIFVIDIIHHATNKHAPPTAFILLSAVLLKNLALTTTG